MICCVTLCCGSCGVRTAVTRYVLKSLKRKHQIFNMRESVHGVSQKALIDLFSLFILSHFNPVINILTKRIMIEVLDEVK